MTMTNTASNYHCTPDVQSPNFNPEYMAISCSVSIMPHASPRLSPKSEQKQTPYNPYTRKTLALPLSNHDICTRVTDTPTNPILLNNYLTRSPALDPELNFPKIHIVISRDS